MEPVINKNSRKLSSAKGQITRLINKLRNVILSEGNIQEINALQEGLDLAREQFIDVTFCHIALLSESERHEEARNKEKEIETMEKKIDDITNEVAEYLKSKAKVKKQLIQEEIKTNEAQNLYEGHLKRIDLPKFSGRTFEDYFQWSTIFNVTVGEQNMPNSVKMLRLLQAVDGEAKELIKKLPANRRSVQEGQTSIRRQLRR